MRSLGLDVGTVTIGIAVSDPLGMFAQPVRTLRRTGRKADVAEIVSLVREREVGTVVIGLPLRTDASEGESAKEARRMAAALAAALPDIPMVLQDERFSTAEAERTLIEGGVRRKKRKQVVDQVAAVLILQSWLDIQ
ncbi:MAG: Holliday junction resolvase RuvX [Rickettsiales bacterium]|nr:Holliday junction resolvase RuvX [Rickettsiales bacterium]|tara:strand:+ start:2122 stop:2532 length:411 start_codon:yes stop_codon:yes gene_type:complete